MGCALAIRLDSPGPVVFSQLRTGRHGLRFPMYKFRTMVQNAEELKASLAAPEHPAGARLQDPERPAHHPGRQVPAQDEPRRAAPDPQRAARRHVARGPAAHVVRAEHLRACGIHERLEVVPGITGLWQVEGRDAMTFDERLRLDAEYVRTLSIRRDFKIMLLTIGSVVRRSGN